MMIPSICSRKKLGMLRTIIFSFSDWRFARTAPKMVGDLVFQDSDQPGPF